MAEYSFNDYLSAFGKAIGQSGTPRTPSAGQSGRQRSAPIAGPGFNQPKPKQETEQKRNLLQKAFDTVSARAAQQEQQKLKAPAVQDDSAYAKGVDFYKNSPMANAPNKQKGTGNLTMDSKIVAAEPAVLAQQGEKVASAARERDDALKRAELAERRAGDIMSYYGGKRDETGTVVFSKDGGAEKYNELQRQAQGHLDAALGAEKNMTKAVEAYNDAAAVAAQAKTDANAAFDKMPETAVGVLAKHGNAAAARYFLERQEERQNVLKNAAKEYMTEDGIADIGKIDSDLTTTRNRISEIDGRLDEIEYGIKDAEFHIAQVNRDEQLTEDDKNYLAKWENKKSDLEQERDALSKERKAVAEDEKHVSDIYSYVWGSVFRQMGDDNDYAAKVKQGKARYDEEYRAYSDSLKNNRAYQTTIALTPEGDLDHALAPFRKEAMGYHPIAVNITALTQEEQDNFYYLVAIGADELAVDYVQQIAAMNRSESLSEIAEWAGTNAFTRFLASVGSIFALPYAGYDMQMYGDNMASTGAGGGIGIGAAADALRGGAAQGLTEKGLFNTGFLSGTINENVPVIGGKGIGDVYQLGMSTVDSFATAMIYGAGATFVLGNKAASSAFNDAVGKGATYEQAVAQGMAQGIAEGIFEYISIDKLLNGDITTGLIKQALAQGGVEASEEIMTSIANSITDRAIMKDKSDFEMAKKEYMAKGYSEKEAESMANRKMWEDIVFDGIGGLFSGGAMTLGYRGVYRQQQAAFNNETRLFADAAMKDAQNSEAYKEGAKIKEMLDNGERVSEEYMRGVYERLGDDTVQKIMSTMGGNRATTPAQVQAQETQQRAEQVQEANPDATVIKSSGTQAYIDSGKATLAVAQKAGDIIDRIVSGDITSGTITSSQIDALLTKHEYGRNVVSKVLGVEVRRAANASQQRQAVRDAIRSYEAQREAMMQRGTADTSEQNIVATGENAPTGNEQDNAVQFDGRMDSAAEARTVAQTQAASEAAPVPSQETRQVVQPERQAGVMKYGSFKYRFQNDKGFRSRYAQGKSASGDASRTLTAYENYRRMMREALDTGEVLTRDAFGRIYSEMNDTKKIKASDAEIDLAYQEYLDERRDAQPQDTETQTEQTAQMVGLFENEFSASVPQEVRTAVDALARELGLRVRYDNLGNDNGYYNTKTGEVVLDVNPARRSVDEAGRSAYLFTVAHEIGHYAKQRMSKTSWAAFERHAISALGGDAALEAKRGEVDESGERVYKTEDDVREDVACDFIGQVMSSGKALGEFVTAIRENKVSTASANGILRAIKRALGKLTGKNKGISEGLKLFSEDIAAGQKAVDEITKALSEVAKQTRSVPTTEQTEANLAEVKKSNKEAWRKTSGTQSNIDNAADFIYNKNEDGGERYDSNRTDRGISEGSTRSHGTGSQDAEARGNGRGHQGLPRRAVSESLSKAFNESGVVAAELYSFDDDRAAFSSALDAAREADAKNGWCVTPQSAEDLSGKLTFMDDGSTIGFVLTDSGDIEGVFKNKAKNKTHFAMNGVIPQAIAAGGTKLDCYGEGLVANYERYGFIPVARVAFNEKYANPGWDASKGKPDIFFMMHNGDSAETVVSKIGTYPHMSEEQLNNLPRYGKDGYDEAKAYRDGLLAERSNVPAATDADIRRSRKDTPRRVIPTPEQAQALEEKRKAREAEQEAERIRRRDEFMRNFVRSAPGVDKHLNRAASDTEIRRSRKDQRIENLVAKHGAIPTGENPVRDVSVPNRTTEDTKVRRTVRTAMEAGVTPEALIPKIEESIVEGSFNYNPKKNADTMEAAHEWVERRKTVDDAYKDWLSAKKNHLNADMIARGFIIYNNYANAAETVKSEAERVRLQQNAVSILQDISVMGTVAGQTAQAMRLLKKQTPESQYYALERAVQKLQDGINDRYGGKKAGAPKIEIDKKLAGKWLQALREGDMELAYDLEAVLFQNIASQIPKTLGDRMNAWRYLSMLGNPKTLIRNAVGNAAFTPVVMAKDKIGAAMELFLEKDKRTKYLGLLHASEEGRALLKFASEDGQSADVLQLMERNKYDDTSLNDRLARYVQEKKRTFTAPVLKQWQAATRYMMEKAPFMGDEFYKSVHYRRAFAGAAMARGYTVSDLTSGKVSETKLMELRVYAANQAMKATFNDANKVSDIVSRARFKNKVANTALEGTLPFKRTPANVAVRSFEYSPAGLLKALSTDIYALKTGKITGQEYIERLSKGATGSIMFGLGWLAAELGIVRVNADDDDEREGRQSYSLEVFGKSVTLDWLAPTSVAFFMGSETQELLSGWGEDQSFLDAMLDSTSNLFAPVLEMTALSGAKDLLDTFVYSYKKDGADVGQITMALFVQPFLSYLGQYAPTIFGQGENLFEPYRTTTYVGDINGKVERVFVRNFAKILEKVPFVDWRQIEYVDEWGRKDYNGDIPLRFFNSFINPAYVNDIVPTEVDAEVRRIKETTGKNVSPTKRGYKITVSEYDEDGEKLGSREVVLSAEQYRDYQMEYGTQYALMASALMASEYYDTLSDSEKAKAFKEIESLADEYGKLAANVGYMIDPGSTDNKLYSLVQMGMPAAEAYSARLMYTQINNDDEIKPVERYEQFRVWVYGNDAWTEEEKQAVIDRFGKFSSGFVVESENFDEMLRLGVDADKAMSINDGIRNLKPEDGLVYVSLSQKYGYILNRSDLNTAEKNAAIKSYMSSNEADAFAPCEAAGITATEYADVVLKIGDLEPIGENKGVTAAQKYEVCVKSFSSEAKQDAMLRRYMSAETEAKYDTLRDIGVSPATYVAWYSAKYTYGDGNGSWKQDELEKWLRENVSSRAQRAALWEATNAGWKNNPFK